MRTSPATTRPLSRIRSRMSTRLVPWYARRGSRVTRRPSQQVSEGSQIDIEIARLEAELLRELVNFLFELHQRKPDALYLLLAETAALHAAHGLPFEQLAYELDQCQHELSEALFNSFGIDLDSTGQTAAHLLELVPEDLKFVVHPPIHPMATKLYGGHGPFSSIRTSGSTRVKRALISAVCERGTSKAIEMATVFDGHTCRRASIRSSGPTSRSISSASSPARWRRRSEPANACRLSRR